jgi:hypothetical protein
MASPTEEHIEAIMEEINDWSKEDIIILRDLINEYIEEIEFDEARSE